MARIQVLPRDLQPGDKIERQPVTPFGLGEPRLCTVARVEKVQRQINGPVYRVHLAEHETLQSFERTAAHNRHLKPFLLYPRNKVTVERGEQ